MIVGFTGTQAGMTRKQEVMLTSVAHVITEGHHGDCIGADKQFDSILKAQNIKRVAHPPIKSHKRAFCDAEVILQCKDYLERDEDIVDVSETMIATPKEMSEVRRSGTWFTIRYAFKWRKPTMIIFPDGTVERRFMPTSGAGL